MTYNIVDIVLVVLALLSVLNGYRRGFILGLLDLLGWSLALVAGLRFYSPVSKWLGWQVNVWSEVWDKPIAFVLIAMVVFLLVELIGFSLITRLPQDIHDRTVNRVFGILPGLANGLITIALVSALLLAVPLSEAVHERARESQLVDRLAVYAQRLEGALHPVFAEAVAETLNLLTIQPESNERVSLPYTVANPRPRPDQEARMLDLVNRERVAAGLKPLLPDPELTEVARRHSADMFARGFFAHVTPEGRDPFERMRTSGVRFLAAGENLALAPTIQVAHSGLMNSPGHRANILNPAFGRLGIGAMDGGLRGLMVTQNFRN